MGVERKKIVINGVKVEKTKEDHILELAGFAAGVCGILFLLQSGQGLSYPVLLIDLAVAAFCIFLWWIHCFSVRAGFWFDWIFGASWLLRQRVHLFC